MAAPRSSSKSGTSGSGFSQGNGEKSVFALEGEAQALSERLPDLMLESLRVANTVAHGIHGRRRAGPGETFWQFRQFQTSDPAAAIDWRRSASSDTLYIREREWEASHTFWLWADLSPSMLFRSHLSQSTKRDRALVLAFAASEMLVRAGERVAYLGLTPPMASRKATSRMAEMLATHQDTPGLKDSLPPPARLSRFSTALLFSDFLDPPDVIAARINEMAAGGVAGHMIQVLDPAEETLPYHGRVEFQSPEGGDRWVADRAETLREDYLRKLAAHREAIADAARHVGWSFLVHRTDRPSSEPLLSLIMRLQGMAVDYRWKADGVAGGAA